MDYKKFYENVKIHFDVLCTDEIRQHAFASKEHDLDFQVFRVLSGYQELLDSRISAAPIRGQSAKGEVDDR